MEALTLSRGGLAMKYRRFLCGIITALCALTLTTPVRADEKRDEQMANELAEIQEEWGIRKSDSGPQAFFI